jgi:hypothetical protein
MEEMNTQSQSATALDPADLLANRFVAQVRERTGFDGPDPYPRPIGAGFEFGRGRVRYAVILNPPGSMLVRVKDGAELAAWTLGSDGTWQERRADRIIDQGVDLAVDSAHIAAGFFDWIQSQT